MRPTVGNLTLLEHVPTHSETRAKIYAASCSAHHSLVTIHLANRHLSASPASIGEERYQCARWPVYQGRHGRDFTASKEDRPAQTSSLLNPDLTTQHSGRSAPLAFPPSPNTTSPRQRRLYFRVYGPFARSRLGSCIMSLGTRREAWKHHGDM